MNHRQCEVSNTCCSLIYEDSRLYSTNTQGNTRLLWCRNTRLLRSNTRLLRSNTRLLRSNIAAAIAFSYTPLSHTEYLVNWMCKEWRLCICVLVVCMSCFVCWCTCVPPRWNACLQEVSWIVLIYLSISLLFRTCRFCDYTLPTGHASSVECLPARGFMNYAH